MGEFLVSISLADLGWSSHFARQIDADDAVPMRLDAVHRTRLHATGEAGPVTLVPTAPAGDYAVGDWVLVTGERASKPLTRLTELVRRTAGRESKPQLIAANVDTLGIVTSCNHDFNVARLERYLALSGRAGCLPLIILTKVDTVDDPAPFVRSAEELSPLAAVVSLDATDASEVARLAPWCSGGRTLALVGSSGVGKTTVQNALTGGAEATRTIREDDAKGRQTTTSRALRPTLHGGWLIDTPGMRELRLMDAEAAIDDVFADVLDIAAGCRFGDCAHDAEPGCAVTEAIARGDLAPERLARFRKLDAENRHNTQTVAEARARDRALGRMYRDVLTQQRRMRGQPADRER